MIIDPALYDSTGTLFATYDYDVWGKLISVKDASGNTITSDSNFAILNSIRYRGYYYDTESGLYYLQSRYYDPTTRRFVNGDSVEYLDASDSIKNYNLFSYCDNNPIDCYDPKGTRAINITLKLLSIMRKNALYLYTLANSLKWFGIIGLSAVLSKFYSLVKTNGKWDFKNQKQWKLKTGDYYIFFGKRISVEDVGNIHFGYVASVLFSWRTMCSGAGLYQIYSGTSSWKYWYSFFDDPRDTAYISVGRGLWTIFIRKFAYQL